jgi:secondary thiamine-phosphate synthase enzyme
MQNLEIRTQQKRQIIDITDLIAQNLRADAKLAHVFIPHTTAAITTMDLDPGTDLDFLDALEQLLPVLKWRHPHDPKHAPDHLLASLIGPDVSVPAVDSRPELGTWQRIVLVELDGPRDRSVIVTTL